MELGGLIVGLGNPGREYEYTRHNFGFMVIDALLAACERYSPPNRLSGQRDPYGLWRVTLPDHKGRRLDWLLATPLTYMNRSGEPVQRIAAYYHIEPESLLVLHDELDLPLGRMKMKKGGGNAGHNGLRSIQQMLGTPDFYRLRLGIGKGRGDGASWVLGRFSEEEREPLRATLAGAVEGLELFMRQGPKKAQQFCNGFSLAAPDAPEEPGKPDKPETREEKPTPLSTEPDR